MSTEIRERATMQRHPENVPSGRGCTWRHPAWWAAAAGFLLCCGLLPSSATAQEDPPQETERGEDSAATMDTVPIAGPRELLGLYGVDESHFDMLRDGAPVDSDQAEPLLKGLYALRKFRPLDVDRWTDRGAAWQAMAADTAAHQGQLTRLTGRVEQVTVLRPVPEVVERLEIDQYYRCRFLINDDVPATIYALAVPAAWPIDEEMSERAGVRAVYLRNAAEQSEPPHPVLMAKRIAWYPESRQLGVLGDLGFDVGLLDHVRNRGSLAGASAEEREGFYQLLAAAGQAGTQELLRRADAELAGLRRDLPARIERLRASAPLDESQQQTLATLQRVLQRAGENRHDAVPLFNQPESQHGRLVSLIGTARRIIRIRVDDEDIVARFGIDHYYEIEIFTDDSQGNPIVFCVREIPPGMPEGEDVHEPVRLAGFFFKTWGYPIAGTRRRELADGGQVAKKQLAPLLIGRAPVSLRYESAAGNSWAAVLSGVFFVLVVAGVWVAIWCYQRGDRRFHRRAIAHLREADVAGSLDQLRQHDHGESDFGGSDRNT